MRGLIVVLALVMGIVAGCESKPKETKDSSAVRGVSKQHAQSMDAERNAFEQSDDPPFNAATRFAAGQLAESQGSDANAITQYVEATKIDPDYHAAWYRLGVLYTRSKQYPKAIDAWERYVKATNGAPAAYSNLGFAYEVSGDRSQAETAYLKGIAKDPKSVPCRTNYGLMLARMGREAQALQQLQTVLTPAEAHYNVGSVYQQLGRTQQAKAQYQKAIELNPQLWEAQSRLAELN